MYFVLGVFMKKKKNNNKKLLTVVILSFLIFSFILSSSYFLYLNYKKEQNSLNLIKEITSHYCGYVKKKKETSLYN